jgi:hypothetical protein
MINLITINKKGTRGCLFQLTLTKVQIILDLGQALRWQLLGNLQC